MTARHLSHRHNDCEEFAGKIQYATVSRIYTLSERLDLSFILTNFYTIFLKKIPET